VASRYIHYGTLLIRQFDDGYGAMCNYALQYLRNKLFDSFVSKTFFKLERVQVCERNNADLTNGAVLELTWPKFSTCSHLIEAYTCKKELFEVTLIRKTFENKLSQIFWA